jgi:chorismate mutase / prephenate dehydratase
MLKKKPPRTPSVADVRRKIDALDRELVKLVNDRTRLAEQFYRHRRDAGEPLQNGAEDQETLARLLELNKGPLPERAIRSLFRELISSARSLVKTTRAAYLGPKYSYSHLAAIEHFGQAAELVPVATIKAVFEELARKQVEFGLVPIENSTDGRIVDTLDMFARMPQSRICGEVQLRVHHHLLGKCARSDVQEVYSKPQAISQCREWLAKHLPQARVVEMTSTAAAAQLAADKPGAAAIASHAAAASYGLSIIDPNIEDRRDNITRFAVIGGDEPRRTGKDKTAIMFELSHKPGSLADALNVFKRNRLNLTWIESFPMQRGKNEYIFFVEFEGHQAESKLKKALGQVASRTTKMEVLGSYPRSAPVE